MKNNKIFLISYTTLDGLLMRALTTLYDDYIDRPKLSEQKIPIEYIVPLPLEWVGTNIASNANTSVE